MESMKELFAASDCVCEVNNAWAFNMKQVFMYLDMSSDDLDLKRSVLIRVSLNENSAQFEILQSLDFGALDYLAVSPEDHLLLVSGGYIHRIFKGEETFLDPITDLFLRGIVPMGDGGHLLYGEDGSTHLLRDGTSQRLVNPSDEEMLAAHFLRPNKGYVCGTFGALVMWDGSRFQSIDLGGTEELQAVHSKPDGTVLLGTNDGTGIAYQNDEIIRVEQADGGIESITTFQGEEYWGDDDFGIYVRRNNELVEKFETEGAFQLNSTSAVMTTVVGAEVYMFDGTDWIQLHVSPSIGNLVSRVPLDFIPL